MSRRRYVISPPAARSLRGFARDERGLAAIEFAFVLPVMLALLELVAVMGQALAIADKVTATARTIVDIVSRNSQLSTTDMSTILNASAFTMAPYASANLSMTVAEIQTDGAGAGTVTWSASAYGGASLPVGSSFTLPAAMATANATYIYGAVSYAYTPSAFGYSFPHPIQLADSAYFAPRVSSAVKYPYPN